MNSSEPEDDNDNNTAWVYTVLKIYTLQLGRLVSTTYLLDIEGERQCHCSRLFPKNNRTPARLTT